jgi:hypothetical protein
MKKVSVRAFQLKPYEFLKDLPIMLTRYGEDLAVLHNANQIIGMATPTSSDLSGLNVGEKPLPVDNVPESTLEPITSSVLNRFCQLCKKPNPAIGLFKFMVYENIEVGEYQEEMYLCAFHKNERKAE